MFSKQPQKVLKSVKSRMGKKEVLSYDSAEYLPEDASALILSHIKKASKTFFSEEPEDVVITVPASFDTDQREATVLAAKKAGFKTQNDDGSSRNILLDEPRAVIYDFINRQNLGEIPPTLLDFLSPKNVLVYDLGGGTLDVSLHKIFWDDTEKRVDFDDLAVSRYTNIGGDDFDERACLNEIAGYEESWTHSTKRYKSMPAENAVAAAGEIAEKYCGQSGAL